MSDGKKKGKRKADAIKSAPKTPEEKKREPVPEKAEAPKKPESIEAKKPEAAAPPAPKPKKEKSLMGTIENAVLIFGFLVMFGSFLPEVRTAVSQSVNVIVSPFTSTMPFFIVVMVIAAIVSVFSTFLQKYTMDWELMRRVMEKNKALQKEMREAQIAGNQAKLKKLQDEQLAGMSEQMELNKMQFKPMGFIAIISVPLFVWAYWYLSQNPTMYMYFPLAGKIILISGGFFIFPWWILWSLLCSMAIGQVIRKAFNVGMPS